MHLAGASPDRLARSLFLCYPTFVHLCLRASVPLLVTLLAAGAAWSLPVCTEPGDEDSSRTPAPGEVLERPGYREHREQPRVAIPAADRGGDPALSDERLLLPCGLAEAGTWCADAAFDVVTPTGVVLCRMDIPALVPGGAPQLERAPAAAANPWGGPAAALAPTEAAVPLALVSELPMPRAGNPGAPRDGFESRTCPPS